MQLLKDVNLDLIQWILGTLLVYVGFTVRRAINGFETSIKDLYKKYDHVDGRVARVETVHEIKGCDSPEEHRAKSYSYKVR